MTTIVDKEQEALEQRLRQRLLDDPSPESYAAVYDELHRFFLDQRNGRYLCQEAVTNLMRCLVALVGTGKRVLEIGIGGGTLARMICRAGNRVVGVDASRVAVELLSQTIGPEEPLEVRVAEARHLPFPDESFDCALSVNLIEHFTRAGAAEHLAEVRRVLKPGASYLIYSPHRLEGPSSLGLHLVEYSLGELLSLVRECGYIPRFVDQRIFALLRITPQLGGPALWPYLGMEMLVQALSPKGVREPYNRLFLPRGVLSALKQ